MKTDSAGTTGLDFQIEPKTECLPREGDHYAIMYERAVSVARNLVTTTILLTGSR